MKRQTIEFKLHEETELPDDMIQSVPRSGPADDAVEDILQSYNIECSESDAVKYLKSVGAWTPEDLSDHDRNLERLVWLACLECQENGTTYFYMGD